MKGFFKAIGKGLGKSWKTTVVGIGVASIPIGHQVLEVLANGQKPDWSQVAFGVGLAALGYLAKDKNVVGKDSYDQK